MTDEVREDAPRAYEVGLDVVASASFDGLNRLAEDGNTVYLDFNELEARADDERDRNHGEYRAVLHRLNKLELNGSARITPSGGKITWEPVPNEEKDDVVYITRSPSEKSRLARDGRKVSFPDFLKYSGQALSSGIIDLPEYQGDGSKITVDDVLEATGLERLHPHQHVIVHDGLVYRVTQNVKEKGEKGSGRFRLTGSPHLDRVDRDKKGLGSRLPSLEARNLEQRLAFDQIVHPDVEVSFLSGGSGSGKTVIAYGAALHLLLGQKDRDAPTYERILLFKTNDIIGGKSRELGFLPGSANEKMWNHLKSYRDAHNLSGAGRFIPFEEMLVDPRQLAYEKRQREKKLAEEGLVDASQSENGKKGSHKASNVKIGEFWLPAKGAALEIEHLQYARGRTFENAVVLVDEAQNYTPFEMKQLIERVGVNSKIIIVGDPDKQIDNPSLSKDFNGFVFAADTLFGSHPRVSFMEFDRNYRSQAAEVMRNRSAPRTL